MKTHTTFRKYAEATKAVASAGRIQRYSMHPSSELWELTKADDNKK